VASQGAYGPPGAELQRLYDADAVDHYIAQLQSHIQDLQRQVGDAMALAEEAQAKVAAAGKSEALLGRALLSAQQAADQAVADAQRQADLIVAEARQEADRLLSDVRADAQRIVDEAHQTVEAVFSALNRQREAEAAQEPDAATAVFTPPPSPAVWAAPDPATRAPEPDDDGFAPEHWPGPADGTIVDLRPGRAASAPMGPEGHDPSAGADWALNLGGTGTDGPLPARAPQAERRPASEPRPDARPRPEPAPERAPVPDPRPAAAELLDRWRLARTAPGSSDNEFLARPGLLAAPTDTSYVSLLRGEAPLPGVVPEERSSWRWLRRPH
jgi:vacuolar-type H+-ATPase subunit H